MVCSGDKTKLLIVSLQAARAEKITPIEKVFRVNVCGENKCESTSEKLLGIVVNNQATWKNHLYGDSDNLGLLKQLSQRVGMLKRLRKFILQNKFKMALDGIFTSKLIYGITVWGGIWGLPGSLDETNRKSTSITKEDMRKLQVLQNSALRTQTGSRYDVPTATLLSKTGQLSVQLVIPLSPHFQTL